MNQCIFHHTISMFSFTAYCFFMLFGKFFRHIKLSISLTKITTNETKITNNEPKPSTFLVRTAKLCNSIPESLFPEKYHLGDFKYRVNRYFLVNYVIKGHPEDYDGSQVWRIKLRGKRDLVPLMKLVDDQLISIWNLGFKQADFLVRPDDKVKVNRALEANKLNHSVLILDVQRRIDDNQVEPVLWDEDTLRVGHRLNWKEYPTLKVIEEYFQYVAENFPSISSVITIGRTSENRSIKLVKISNGNPDNKGVLIIAGMHAREWIAITSALYILDTAITKYDNLPKYMKNVDLYIIPVLNPDGYEYSHTKDRLWRKNRRKLGNGECYGVDINRNFDLDFNVDGLTEKNECFEGYSGPGPFSEAESEAVRDFILSTTKKPVAAFDLHSYGQLIMYPWSARADPSPDQKILWTSAKTMSESFFNNTGKRYNYGAIYHLIYPATGAAVDWLHYTGVSLTFGIELGDEGEFGFILPADNIETTGRELLTALDDMLKALDPMIKNDGVITSWF